MRCKSIVEREKSQDIKDAEKLNEKEIKQITFDSYPEKLKKIILDLENNYKIVNRISEGIQLNFNLYNKFKEDIFSNYPEDIIQFLNFLFKLNMTHHYDYMAHRALLNHFNYHVPSEIPETSISTPTNKISLDEKTRGEREESLPGSSSSGDRGLEDKESASIENSPLDDIPELVNKPITDLQVHIDEKTIKHFSKLMIRFDKKDEEYKALIKKYGPIFNKIEQHFQVSYNKWGKAWPEVFIDKEKKVPASFGLHITKGGYLELALNRKIVRKVGLKKIVQEIYKVFSFLGRADFERLLFFFKLDKSKNKVFVHLANKLWPKEKVDKKLKGAILSINYIDFYGEDLIHVKVDYSKGPEIEIEGEESTSMNLHSIIVEPAKAVKTIRGIAANVEEIMDLLYMYLMKGLNESHKLTIKNGQVLVSIQKEIKNNHQEALAYISETDMNNKNEHLQRQIEHKIIENRIVNRIVKTGNTLQIIQQDIKTLEQKSIPELKNEISFYYGESNKAQLKSTETLIDLSHNTKQVSDNIGKLAEAQIIIKDEIQEKIESAHKFTNGLIIDTSNGLHDKIDKIDTKIEEKFDSFDKSIKGAIKEGFESFGKRFKNNLELVIRQLHELPGRTAYEISQEINLSKSTVYSYLKKLQGHNLIESYKISTGQKGRPKGFYVLSDKIKNLIKNRIKNNKKGDRKF